VAAATASIRSVARLSVAAGTSASPTLSDAISTVGSRLPPHTGPSVAPRPRSMSRGETGGSWSGGTRGARMPIRRLLRGGAPARPRRARPAWRGGAGRERPWAQRLSRAEVVDAPVGHPAVAEALVEGVGGGVGEVGE